MNRTHSIVLATLLAGCASNQIEPVGPAGPPLESYTAEAIKAAAKTLLATKGFDGRVQETLIGRLDSFLEKEETKTLMNEKGATAVAVYNSATGGFLISGGSGEGVVSFKGGGQAVPFKMSGYSAGAVVGGGTNHGVVVVFGLRDQRRFAGNYSMKGVEATAVSASVNAGVATYDGGVTHELRYFATGFGLSLEAGMGSYAIEFSK
jgi:lipid-binding SYLF domain-containing protein